MDMKNEQVKRMKEGKLYQPMDDGIFEEQLLLLEKLQAIPAVSCVKSGKGIKKPFLEQKNRT